MSDRRKLAQGDTVHTTKRTRHIQEIPKGKHCSLTYNRLNYNRLNSLPPFPPWISEVVVAQKKPVNGGIYKIMNYRVSPGLTMPNYFMQQLEEKSLGTRG